MTKESAEYYRDLASYHESKIQKDMNHKLYDVKNYIAAKPLTTEEWNEVKAMFEKIEGIIASDLGLIKNMKVGNK